MLYLHGTKIKLRTVPEYGSTRVEFDVYMENVKIFRATRVLLKCTRVVIVR